METRVRDQVHCNLAQVAVELTGEAKGARRAGHAHADQVIQVTVRGCRELERAEADVVESLVIHAERLVSVLADLVHGECGVVRLNDCVGHLG